VDELVEQRRLDELAGIDLPDKLEDLVGRVRDADFWGPFGLCGGMSWASLDRFSQGEEIPPDRKVPERSTDLFNELVRRQADSMQRGRMLTDVRATPAAADKARVVAPVATDAWQDHRAE
jgi:hypothetical protein